MGLKESFRRLKSTKISFGSEESTVKASDGISRDAWYAVGRRDPQFKDAKQPDDNLELMLKIFKEDPVVNTAISTRVNAMLDSGWTVEGEKTPKTAAEKVLKKIGFNYSFLRQVFFNAMLYRHVFIEIERNANGEPTGLYVLDAPQMEIENNKHGEILGYKQVAVTGEEVFFPIENIVYMPFDQVATSMWGTNGIKSIYRTITSRNSIEEFLNSLAVTNAWRDITKVKRMNKDDVGSYISYLRDMQSNPTMPFVINQPPEGDIVSEPLRSSDDLNNFMDLLSYLRSQILMLFKVPPIMVGLPDNSNRSNSDTQFTSFNIANEADRTIVADFVSNELFEKIGISTVDFSWNPIDVRSEKEDVEIAEKLMNMGGKPEKIEDFLRKGGLDIPEDFFPTEEEMLKKQEAMFAMKAPDDAASRPSRERKDGEASDKIGTGSDSSTREEQLR